MFYLPLMFAIITLVYLSKAIFLNFQFYYQCFSFVIVIQIFRLNAVIARPPKSVAKLNIEIHSLSII